MHRLGIGSFGVLLLVIIVLAIVFPVNDYVPAAAWGEELESAGIPGMSLFLLAGMLATSVGLPRQLVAFIAGLAYGIPLGLTLSLVATLAGCLLTANVSRRFLSSWVSGKFPKIIATLNSFVGDDLFLKVLVLRLQPLGTNLMSNVCIGFTKASLPIFLLASAVGYIPQMMVFIMLGAGLRVESQAQLMLSIILLVLSLVLAAIVYRRHIANMPVDESAE